MLDLWLIGLVVCFVGGLRLVVYGFSCDCMILRVLCILLLLWLGWGICLTGFGGWRVVGWGCVLGLWFACLGVAVFGWYCAVLGC